MAIPSLTAAVSTAVAVPVSTRATAAVGPSVNNSTATVSAAGSTADLTLSNPQVAEQVDAYLRASGHDMKFSVDDETGQTIVRIYNSSTGDLVRQIPSEDLVRLARALKEGEKQTLDIRV
ncbi:MAG: flagellar protein FlaG [Steroidobacteraceae bacterium]